MGHIRGKELHNFCSQHFLQRPASFEVPAVGETTRVLRRQRMSIAWLCGFVALLGWTQLKVGQQHEQTSASWYNLNMQLMASDSSTFFILSMQHVSTQT